MLSRVADAIHWMCRYVERADNVARFIQVNQDFILDLPSGAEEQWEPLVNITADNDWFAERYKAPTRDNVLAFLVCDPEYGNSIFSCVRAARENARSVRDALSSEVWENLNRFYLGVQDATGRGAATIAEHPEILAEIKREAHLFFGSFDRTMSHGEAWHFGRLGESIERADKTSRILDVKYFHLLPSVRDVGGPLDETQWAAVLKSVGGLEMYRRRYRRITPDKAVEFLVIDREFPRSMLYALNQADIALRAIGGTPVGQYSNAAEQRLGQLNAQFSFAGAKQILQTGLHEFLDNFQTQLNAVGSAVHATYFAASTEA